MKLCIPHVPFASRVVYSNPVLIYSHPVLPVYSHHSLPSVSPCPGFLLLNDGPTSSTVSDTAPLLSMKFEIRFLGSHLSSGMTTYEINAKIVTAAMMIGASNQLADEKNTNNLLLYLQFRLAPVTGNAYGENNTATTHPFQNTPISWNGLLNRPRFHFGLGNRLGVHKSRPRQITPYAAALGTPAAETKDVKATFEAKSVQVMIAPTLQTTMTAFLGCPLWTRETQLENGRTPSRATAKTSRDAATMAIAVFYSSQRVKHFETFQGDLPATKRQHR